jgi:hypothetical protein
MSYLRFLSFRPAAAAEIRVVDRGDNDESSHPQHEIRIIPKMSQGCRRIGQVARQWREKKPRTARVRGSSSTYSLSGSDVVLHPDQRMARVTDA